MAEMREVVCCICKGKFKVKAKIQYLNGGIKQDMTQKKNRVCVRCKDLQEKDWEKKRSDRMKKADGEGKILFVANQRLEDVAKRLGMSVANAKVIERKALAKIREDPKLLTLYRNWVEDGAKVPAAQEDMGETLVSYMLELTEWYEIYAVLLGAGETEDAVECQAEIENFHKVLNQQLAKMQLITK